MNHSYKILLQSILIPMNWAAVHTNVHELTNSSVLKHRRFCRCWIAIRSSSWSEQRWNNISHAANFSFRIIRFGSEFQREREREREKKKREKIVWPSALKPFDKVSIEIHAWILVCLSRINIASQRKSPSLRIPQELNEYPFTRSSTIAIQNAFNDYEWSYLNFKFGIAWLNV